MQLFIKADLQGKLGSRITLSSAPHRLKALDGQYMNRGFFTNLFQHEHVVASTFDTSHMANINFRQVV